MKVEIAMDLAVNGVGNWFTLDDPVKGKLNDATYLLSGELLVDVTSSVREIQTQRGRSRQLERFTAGNAMVVLDNRNRNFDPTNTSSPYAGSIVPKKRIRISRDNEIIFTGNIDDWNFTYSLNRDAVAEVQATDGFSVLAVANYPAGTSASALPGARIGAVLDAISWPAAQRSLSTGVPVLDEDVRAEPVEALAYMQKVETSEPGALFIGKAGDVVFRDRNDLQTYSSSVVFSASAIPFQTYGVVYGVEELWNDISVTWSNGASVAGPVTASSATSQAAYGKLSVTYDTLLDQQTDAEALASWLIGQYAEPRLRIDTISVNVEGLSSTLRSQVLGLELGDVVLVQWQPGGVGSVLSQYATIDGISHAAAPMRHEAAFTLSETVPAFILDDPVFGILDSNILGF